MGGLRDFGLGLITGLIPGFGFLGTTLALKGKLKTYEGRDISSAEKTGLVIGMLGQIAYWAALGVEIVKNLS